jgi:hypothetical protein
MEHGNNRPLELKSVEGRYQQVLLFFLADAPSGYELFGGHPTAGEAGYDLRLVQHHLLNQPAREVSMSPAQAFTGSGWKAKFFAAFQGTKWGLYVVLGLLTLVLLLIVARLFPKA